MVQAHQRSEARVCKLFLSFTRSFNLSIYLVATGLVFLLLYLMTRGVGTKIENNIAKSIAAHLSLARIGALAVRASRLAALASPKAHLGQAQSPTGSCS